MLNLPAFDVVVLHGIEAEQSIVGGECVLRKDWLLRVRKEYEGPTAGHRDLETWEGEAREGGYVTTEEMEGRVPRKVTSALTSGDE